MSMVAAGTSYGTEMQVPQGFTQSTMIASSTHGGRKRIIEGSEEDQLRKERKKIKNRASAARSREKKVERTKYLEETVEELREENTQLEKLIKLLQMEEEEEEELRAAAAQGTSERLNSLKRTVSAPW